MRLLNHHRRPAMTSASLQVLVVEDNQAFLQVLCEMLERLGHRPHGVPCAEDAIALLQEHRFQVLIVDIQLPGISGIEFAKIAARSEPGIRVIFSSGFSNLLMDALDFDFAVLHKPYFLNQLKHAVESDDSGRRSMPDR
jgi:CheY-like chemotaxis protein